MAFREGPAHTKLMTAVPNGKPRHWWRLSYESRLFVAAIVTGSPGLLVAELLLWHSGYSSQTKITITALLLVTWIITAVTLRNSIVRPLQTTTNMVAALREEDFSFRARGATRDDALGELVLEINLLSDTLQTRRVESLEAVALLKKVVMEIDVAVFTFDPHRHLKIVNRAGEQLLATSAERLLGKTAHDLHLEPLLRADIKHPVFMRFAGKEGRWAIRYTTFRENGIPHELLIISDLSRALREEERLAWQRLIRVLGHELNNSLAPIKSIAGTLRVLASREQLGPEWQVDMRKGLEVIETRADALSRFMQAYTKLAKLPAPTMKRVELPRLIQRVASMESRVPVKVESGADVAVDADADQLEQLLINIIRNAADASLDGSLREHGPVEVSWQVEDSIVEIAIRDEGPGLLNNTNLFVPFFTTKAGGSGIGLVLSRQIAESHGGSVTLANRTDRRGCEALVTFPVHIPGQESEEQT